MPYGDEYRRLKNSRFFVGAIVIQIAINVAGGIGTYSSVLSHLPT
jgi:hypothetical protein